MALTFLNTGFEQAVRSKLGVTAGELPDADINQRLVAELAEKTILSKLPPISTITSPTDHLIIEGSMISYICYLVCPGMARRVNLEVASLDMKWKKDKVRWEDLAESFLAESESALLTLESVVITVGDGRIVDYSRNTRTPVG